MPIPSPIAADRAPLRETVVERLRSAIVDGTLAPGERLRDGEVATWLGVSRTPVREAILELAASGLVRSAPGRSPVVAPIDDASISDARAVVASMHRLAVRDAVARFTDADIDRMRAANAAFANAHRRHDVEAALAADDAFHAVAVEVCGNAAARAVLDVYTPVLRRAERLRFGSSEGAESVARHDMFIGLCAARDVAGATSLAEHTWDGLALHPDTNPTPRRGPA